MLDRSSLSMLSPEEEEGFRSYAEGPELGSVTVTFNSQVTFRQLYSIYKKIRGILGKKSVPPLQSRVQELVQQEGEPKKKWSIEYWESIQRQLREEGYQKVPKSIQGAAQIYYRNVVEKE